MLTASTACPGLFYNISAQDGILSRVRIPGGILNSEQCQFIANIADNCGGGYVDITNRANLQIREIKTGINIEILQRLQELGLGSANPTVDHIRNIMTSPTAGIDPQELIDTQPFVKAWDDYITEHPHLAGLSAKFSVGFDGGGKVSVQNCVNDITFAAVAENGNVYFQLYLSFGEKGQPPQNTGILLKPDECLPVLAVLADVYLDHIGVTSQRKRRLREVINDLGIENYLRLAFTSKSLTSQLPGEILHLAVDKFGVVSHYFCQLPITNYQLPAQTDMITVPANSIGIHPQKQAGLFYIGVVLPLGRWETWQMRRLADLAAKYGNGNLRVTPWQNLLVTDIPKKQVAEVETEITRLGLNISPTNIKTSLVACSGKRGCAASATETKDHALALADYLEYITLEHPINIHFSGCVKSCAQHQQADITLLGVRIQSENETMEGYQLYIGDGKLQKFGYQLYEYVTFAELPKIIATMLCVYKNQRLNLNESFREFVYRYDTSQLQRLFTVKSIPNPKSHV
ncbi:precorrin-3B synthase [Anabaena cylindrica FACHB-243]|uniref:Assimilatory nitrite reductase (Ferredoxin) n=1 Tax=Anabaena cylindrica (strain ATCC 27899 / PCC 7122) TaxID=272123 RepID=K9ZQ46_ANACC|nr:MULTISPECIES: precorrin-3B synthase [Anabaena]AFZ60475.1 assimilatory nitrite reductase (ferredoxin) precursor [Anabaena cylindrica PCC 7122]MBD2416460.1 precorrin-3B synthase [Anabaena cylindrica FACHB-243]MBY5284828.1 precorrin-3B synthase [Anabaena sp. CCAP 1446/1C]MBY5310388.1 precorrin-3B synthase [Anabaena sp. CCAP 1446/1C]MCM2408515.1 precorrin-3B synthase [Anabaena sp. CCAP 1446/1C]